MVVPESTMSTLPESVLEAGQEARRSRGCAWSSGLASSSASPSTRRSTTRRHNQTLSQVLYIAGAAMGLNLLTGFNGQVSIGHGAFFGIGAFTTGILVVDHGWPLELTIPVGALLAALVGVPSASRRCGCAACTSRSSRSASPCCSPGWPASTSTASAAWPCCSPAAGPVPR